MNNRDKQRASELELRLNQGSEDQRVAGINPGAERCWRRCWRRCWLVVMEVVKTSLTDWLIPSSSSWAA